MATAWSYDAALESRDAAALRERYGPFVDGRPTDGSGDPTPTVNPATGDALAEVGTAAGNDVEAAVRAARRCYDRAWSRMAGAERAKYLYRVARLVQERASELAVLEALDAGTPVRAAREIDVPAAAAQFFHHAGWADKLGYAGFGPDPRPLGVVGQVVTWHAPLLAAAARIAPALACGNTVVLKPARATPLAALVLAEICREAELPPGAVNVLPGDGVVGAALAVHVGIDALGFTGSPEVGRQLQYALAGTGRPLHLELCGGAGTVVYDDAPVDQAVEGVVAGAFGSRDPRHTAGTRLLVAEPLAEEFAERLRARATTLRVGDPLDRNTDVGPLVSRRRLDRVTEHAATGDAEGARRWSAPVAQPGVGFYYPPTLFTGVSPSMTLAREEVPGPVLPVLTFRTPDEAVALAADRPTGSSAAVWTEKGSRALWTAQRLRGAVVWANTAHRVDATAPIGGRTGLEAYLHA